MWSACCSSWSIWFWIFNKTCQKRMSGRRLNSYFWKLELLITPKFQSHFKATLGIGTINPTSWNNFPKNGEKYCQMFQPPLKPYFWANLYGVIARLTSQSSEITDFYCDHKKADTKMLVYIKFLCDDIRSNRVIIVLPDTDVVMISKCH